MPEGLEDADVAVETHSLLLSLAGLIDDELLGWCRELVAVGESDYALELVAAAVQADRVRLPGPLHADLLDAVHRRRVLGRGESLPPPDTTSRMPHRFAADPTEVGFPARPIESSPEAALRAIPRRLVRDCQLWLSWRLTPAGGAPGPLPHPVVLIETLDTVGAEVLAYQVAEVLARAGVFASVEVFSTELELDEYHRAALAQSHSVLGPEEVDELGTARLAAQPEPPAVSPSPRPRPQPQPQTPASPEPAREVTPRRVPENGAPRPSPTPQEGSRRPPMHPVDRVITARSSAPRRPRPDRQPGSLDDVASGLNFERGNPPFPAEPETTSDDDEHGQPEEPRAERRPPERPRDTLWSASRDQPPPRDTPSARDDAPKTGPLPSRGSGPSGTDRGNPPRPNPSAQLPKRPSPRPPEGPPPPPDDDPPGDLSDVEQRLLRQLHEELASREDQGMPMLPDADQPPSRVFRSANGGRKRPPRSGPERAN